MSAPPAADGELLARARRGDSAALAELRGRHLAAARRFASLHGGIGAPDGLVDAAFARALTGPEPGAEWSDAFRVHLFVTLRRLAGEGHGPDEVPERVRRLDPEARLAPPEREMVLAAFASLPERWQVLLWQTAVEGHQPLDLAPSFGLSSTAAAALAYRGREKLRQAYVEAHLERVPRPQCAPHRARLVAYVRDGLGRRDQAATEEHIAGCDPCGDLVDGLRDIDGMLVAAVQPSFLSP